MKFEKNDEPFDRKNTVLKFAKKYEFALVAAIIIYLLQVFARPALVFERGCTTRALSLEDPEQTNLEINNFVHESLMQRFDTDRLPNKDMLSESELKMRTKEQRDFAQQNIKQRILVNLISFEDPATMTVKADRVVSVGNVRSAFPLNLQVTVATVRRSAENPYGLFLISTKQQSEK